MRFGSATLKDVVKYDHNRQFIADLYVGRDRVLPNLQLSDLKLVWDGTAKVLCTGTASIVYSDDWGSSITPRDLTSWLAPYSSWLDIRYRVTVGPFTETVTLGRLALQKPSNPKQSVRNLGTRTLSNGALITVSLIDAFGITNRERLVLPGSSPAGTTGWKEIRRLTGWPVRIGAVPDHTISTPVVYQESRLDAVFDVAQQVLNGHPFMDSDNTVAAWPTTWGDPVADLRDGEGGEVISVEVEEWDTSTVYNQVVVRAEDNDQSAILATAQITEGRLRYGLPSEGAWGRIPYFVSSQFIKDADAAQVYADNLLPVVSQQTAVTATVTIVPNPLLQCGDVVTFPLEGSDTPTRGRIQKITFADVGGMELVVACEQR